MTHFDQKTPFSKSCISGKFKKILDGFTDRRTEWSVKKQNKTRKKTTNDKYIAKM